MTYPLISCICPTYNRPPTHHHLIEEAIGCFMLQDYPNRELVILNDTPGQELRCDVPGVRIINEPARFAKLGEKCNALVGHAHGDLIAPWDDDDISLPWRLSLSYELLGDGEYFNPRNYLFLERRKLSFDEGHGYAHNASLFRRSLFERVGGYRPINVGFDRDIDHAFAKSATSAYDPLHRNSAPLPEKQLFYIYRWGVSRLHVSSGAKNDEGRYDAIGRQTISAGVFDLRPQWREDYLSRFEAGLAERSKGGQVSNAHSLDEDGESKKSLPLVSCICPTYNRAPKHLHLVEEAIESFLRQDYPNKELLVVNDTPGQELLCDLPGVSIINVSRRFASLGEKLNAIVGLSNGELIAPWDDDDISLPWRLSFSVEKLGDCDYFNPRGYWFRPPDGLRYDHQIGYSHNASLFRREAFDSVGRYRSISSAHDRDLDQALLAGARKAYDSRFRKSPALEIADWFYIYRWGVSPGHVSGVGGDNGAYAKIGARRVVKGSFQLTPQWRIDYEAEAREMVQKIGVESVSKSASC